MFRASARPAIEAKHDNRASRCWSIHQGAHCWAAVHLRDCTHPAHPTSLLPPGIHAPFRRSHPPTPVLVSRIARLIIAAPTHTNSSVDVLPAALRGIFRKCTNHGTTRSWPRPSPRTDRLKQNPCSRTLFDPLSCPAIPLARIAPLCPHKLPSALLAHGCGKASPRPLPSDLSPTIPRMHGT